MNSPLVVDLHVHSRFAIGCSRALNLETLGRAAAVKGIDVLATGDFTHPAWADELRAGLRETGDGVYEGPAARRFILGTEIACVWRAEGRGRRVHVLVLAPSLEAAAKLSAKLGKHARLASDGRPMTGLSAEALALLAWEADERCVVIPAHVWTPWYGMYGSKSGFDTIEECFGKAASGIRAIETGLSSDPAMNWRVSELDGRAIVSFSDAHSPGNLGRELTVLDAAPGYDSIRNAMASGRVLETIEFFPEHGKYHLDGHSRCGVRLTPSESATHGGRCPRCGRLITLGVLNRVEQLAGRPGARMRIDRNGLVHGPDDRPPFRSLVPLAELVGESLGRGKGTKAVRDVCSKLVGEFGSELAVLTEVEERDVERALATDTGQGRSSGTRSAKRGGRSTGAPVASAIAAVRARRVNIEPGYDGEYGTVSPLT